MTFIDSYEDQLVDAARRRRDARLRNRLARFLRAPRRRGAAIAIAALVVGVPAAAATVGKWDPFDDPGGKSRFEAPSRSDKAIDPELTATLGVLRRPQTDPDRGAAASKAAKGFRLPGYRGVKLDGIRLVDRERGIVLVPFERSPVPTDASGKPLPGFDPATYTNVVCIFQQTADSFAGVGCHSADKIKSGRALSSGSGTVTGLVPDGVDRVVLRRGDEGAEVPVRDNFFAADAEQPTVVEWLGPDGEAVQRFDLTAPPPGP